MPVLTTDRPTATTRRLSGFKPTGLLHLGNFLGAIRPMVVGQATPAESRSRADDSTAAGSIVMIADLHALTVEHDPERLRAMTLDALATLLAAGVDPARTVCYVQSDLPEHAELHYLLECATGYGEAARMIQFREKSKHSAGVRLSLLTYPVLMAADILLHDAAEVPVGDDQTQHLELARDVANRFNTRYGRTFVVPRAVNPDVAARVMDLADPTAKMDKTAVSDAGTVYLLDEPDVIRRKVMRAVTDPGPDVRYDPYRRPGVANLLEILAACEGRDRTGPSAAEGPDGPERMGALADRFRSYGELKEAVATAVVDLLRPVRERREELLAAPDHLRMVREEGALRARERAVLTVQRAKRAIGLT